MSLVIAYYHLVINTKHRQMTLCDDHRQELYRVIRTKLEKESVRVVIINGIRNHIHILLSLSPVVSLSDVVRNLKQSTSLWIKRSGKFPYFSGWGKEYFASTVSPKIVPVVREYIANQQIHHSKGKAFEDELVKLVKSAGAEWNDYLLS